QRPSRWYDSYRLATVLRSIGPERVRMTMGRDFHRIAIVNRGEPAVRLIHAVREYNRESGAAVRAIAFHTAAERQTLFVREADEAVCLDDYRHPGDAGSPYLDHSLLARAIAATRADAVWPGWGFVAEDAAF